MKSRKLTGRELCRAGPGSSDEHRMQYSFRCLESYSEQPSEKTGSKLGRGGDTSGHDLKLGEAWVRAKYKCVAKKVKPGALSDGRTPDRGLNWRERAFERATETPSPWDE